jgi:hypothetical protein
MAGYAITTEESSLIDKRKKELDTILNERMPVLVEFFTDLEAPQPHAVLTEAERYVDFLGAFMENQVVGEEDVSWVVTRTGYFIGEYLVQKYQGCWMVNETPDSRTFGRIVTGRFLRLPNQAAMVDPFEVAVAFVRSFPPRSLKLLLQKLEQELAGA